MEINLAFFAYFVLSFLVFFLAFYIPGRLVCSHWFPKINGKIPLSFAIGIALWSIQSYFLNFVGARDLVWIYFLSGIVLFFATREKVNLSCFPKIDKVLLVTITLGVLFQVTAVFPSGLKDSQGIWFYHINAYDGLYYLGLVKALVANFPPIEPGFSGHVVINYHYFSDLVLADIVRMFKLPPTQLQFQTFPLLISVLLGFLAYTLGIAFTGSKNAGRIFTFFIYFGSDIGYLTSLVLLGSPSVTSLQAIDRANMLLVNMPRAVASVVLLAGLVLLFQYFKVLKKSMFVIASLVLVSTTAFKVYVGIFSAMVIGLVATTSFVRFRKIFYLLALIPVYLFLLALYLPTNHQAGGLFWAPFAWPRHWFASTALQATQWHLKEQVFKEHNNNLRILILNLQETCVFLFTIFGTRILGLLAVTPKRFSSSYKHYTLYIPTVAILFIGVFFLQKSGIYNTFNFFSLAAILLSLFASCLLARIKNATVFAILVTLTIILTIPRPLSDLQSQIQSVTTKGKDAYLINQDELAALNFIKENTRSTSVILSGPNNPRDYYSPYIEYFSQRPTFLSNLFILEAHNHPVAERTATVNEIFASVSKEDFFAKLQENKIDYVYIKRPITNQLNFKYSQNEIFFENKDVLVLKVN